MVAEMTHVPVVYGEGCHVLAASSKRACLQLYASSSDRLFASRVHHEHTISAFGTNEVPPPF